MKNQKETIDKMKEYHTKKENAKIALENAKIALEEFLEIEESIYKMEYL